MKTVTDREVNMLRAVIQAKFKYLMMQVSAVLAMMNPGDTINTRNGKTLDTAKCHGLAQLLRDPAALRI